MKRKVLCIFGTRPEAIKMAPVVQELHRRQASFETVVCVTAQHRHMLDQVLSLFEIKPDIDLDLMERNQTLDSLTARALTSLAATLQEVKPDAVLVQGDTTTAMAATMAAFYEKVPVGHVEAGLRTNDRYNPFPEEMNRQLISVLSTYHFAPTKKAFEALRAEGASQSGIFITGNTVIDALHFISREKPVDYDLSFLKHEKMILVTAHRRENFGKPFEDICAALKTIVANNKDTEIVYPVHLNPNVQEPVTRMLKHVEGVHLIPPVEYQELICLMRRAHIVLTDSGGIQEEAPAFGKPVLVMRKETERPEGIEAGVAKLVGTDTGTIVREVELLLRREAEYLKMAQAVSPYGDGKAAERIVSLLEEKLSLQDTTR